MGLLLGTGKGHGRGALTSRRTRLVDPGGALFDTSARHRRDRGWLLYRSLVASPPGSSLGRRRSWRAGFDADDVDSRASALPPARAAFQPAIVDGATRACRKPWYAACTTPIRDRRASGLRRRRPRGRDPPPDCLVSGSAGSELAQAVVVKVAAPRRAMRPRRWRDEQQPGGCKTAENAARVSPRALVSRPWQIPGLDVHGHG